MAHAENSTVIGRAPEIISQFVADGTNNPKWRDGVVDIRLIAGEPGKAGASYNQTLKGPMGRTIAGDYTITELVPGKRLAFKVVAGPARPTGSYLFEANDKGTKVTFVLELPAKGIMGKLMDGMIQKTMQTEVASLAKLKAVLEDTKQSISNA